MVGEVNGDSFVHPLSVGDSRYYWIRAVNKLGQTSTRVPDSDTSTFFAISQAGGGSLFIDPGFNLYPDVSDYWVIEFGDPTDFAITANGANGDGAFENSMVLTERHGQITTLIQTCSLLLDLAVLYDGARVENPMGAYTHDIELRSTVFPSQMFGEPVAGRHLQDPDVKEMPIH